MLTGGTPEHILSLNVDAELLSDLEVTYSQSDTIILQKYLSKGEVTIEDGKFVVRFTQEETFMFNQNDCIEIQSRPKTLGGDVIPTNIIYDTPSRCLSKVIL
jgi:hypothetical protein